jgi:hypothetical protein
MDYAFDYYFTGDDVPNNEPRTGLRVRGLYSVKKWRQYPKPPLVLLRFPSSVQLEIRILPFDI